MTTESKKFKVPPSLTEQEIEVSASASSGALSLTGNVVNQAEPSLSIADKATITGTTPIPPPIPPPVVTPPPATGRIGIETEITFETADQITSKTPPDLTHFNNIEKGNFPYALTREQLTTGWTGRFEVRKGDMIDGRYRVEGTMPAIIMTDAVRKQIVGFNLMLRSGTDKDRENHFQVHDFGDPGESGRVPNIDLAIENGGYDISIQGEKRNSNEPWASQHIKLDNCPQIGTPAADKDKMVFWAFEMYWHHINGVTKLYKNGVLIYTYNGPNCYNDQYRPYMKFGFHKPGWASTGSGSIRAVNIDNIRIGNEKATLKDVTP